MLCFDACKSVCWRGLSLQAVMGLYGTSWPMKNFRVLADICKDGPYTFAPIG